MYSADIRKAKVSYLGADIRRKANQHYKESTWALRWREIKAGATIAWHYTKITLAVLILMAVSGATVYVFTDNTVAATNTIVVQAPPIIDIEKAKTDMVHQLALRENHGGVPGYLDDNSKGTLPKKDKISYGVMAFKISTVQRFAKECNGATLTNEQAVVLAIDESKAKDLAKCAIFEHNHLNEWSAATQEMFTTVKVINKLTK